MEYWLAELNGNRYIPPENDWKIINSVEKAKKQSYLYIESGVAGLG